MYAYIYYVIYKHAYKYSGMPKECKINNLAVKN